VVEAALQEPRQLALGLVPFVGDDGLCGLGGGASFQGPGGENELDEEEPRDPSAEEAP
jgi:hypothetical protein